MPYETEVMEVNILFFQAVTLVQVEIGLVTGFNGHEFKSQWFQKIMSWFREQCTLAGMA